MIDTLYDKFKPWSAKGSVYIISDTHFEDEDCKLMDVNWIEPQEHINIIKKVVHKCDTLIHLGNVGNPKWLEQIKAYKVLVMGNHDETATQFKPYFDEIYTGPVFIAEKILLSHEPIINGSAWYNIHGHDHDASKYKEWKVDSFAEGWNDLNLASNVVDYKVYNLGKGIKHGLISNVDGVHRLTIDKARNK